MPQSTDSQHIVVIAGAFIGVARRSPRDEASADAAGDDALEAFEERQPGQWDDSLDAS